MPETPSILQRSKITSIVQLAPTSLARHYIILMVMQQAMHAHFLPVQSRSDMRSACKTLTNLHSAYLARGTSLQRLVSPEASWQSRSTSGDRAPFLTLTAARADQ